MSSDGSNQTQEVMQEPEKRDPPSIKVSRRVSKSRPVVVYLTILFVVALLLLVMSFFMQQRSSEALENLNESMSNTQDLSALQMDNQRLEYELEQTRQDLKLAEDAADLLQKQADALEWLRQIEAATRSSYPKAKALLEAFEAEDLPQYLPDASVVEGEEPPAERYRAIYAMFY